jgi:ketosteroid isomerase-like protein
MQLMTFKLFSSFALELVEVHECLDPDELIAEYRSDAVVERNGNEYRNRYIGVFRFRDGKISHWREFHNPEATKVL